MAFRDDLTALGARRDALTTEVQQKTRELDEAARLYAEADARRRLPVLDNIRVATPCHERWDDMTGDDRVRHCGSCKKDVFQVSGLTRAEAEALVLEKAGNLCVRYYQRQDGTILLADCSVGVGKRRRKTRVLAASAIALLSGAGATWLSLRAGKHAAVRAEIAGSEMMGQAMAPPESYATMGGSAAPPDVYTAMGVTTQPEEIEPSAPPKKHAPPHAPRPKHDRK